MVLIAAGICTKGGKTLISRQFVEMTKPRIEGLLATFPKLIPSGKQHTFVETDSVRYVYQPLEKLYMVLITTKASNILEDLETLRLFSKVVPEYCKSLEESDIYDNAFNLLFAFDEIVALGYRENVNLAQIRTFVEMDSHEEKVYQAVRKSQERDAMQKMREKAKELQRQKLDANKKGIKMSGTNLSSSSFNNTPTAVSETSSFQSSSDYSRPSFQKSTGSSKALKLGGKNKDVDSFVNQLKSEGENVAPLIQNNTSNNVGPSTPEIDTESVHIKIDESMTLTAGKDGGLHSMEVHGTAVLHLKDDAATIIRIQFENSDTKGAQIQTHPNVDKDLFKQKKIIGLKNPQKPFPTNSDVPILKWRYHTSDEMEIPLTINCWPTPNGSGGCEVNIEYELQSEDLELENVVVAIPIPQGSGGPVVGECEGEYNYENRKHILFWKMPVIDSTNRTGSMEFSVASGSASHFFPIEVSFQSSQSFIKVYPVDVKKVDIEEPVKFSTETSLSTKVYKIV